MNLITYSFIVSVHMERSTLGVFHVKGHPVLSPESPDVYHVDGEGFRRGHTHLLRVDDQRCPVYNVGHLDGQLNTMVWLGCMQE